MKTDLSRRWRPLFILAALLILVGGPQHPGGTDEEMLGHPGWVRAHAIITAGFVALLIGLVQFARGRSLPDRSRKWLRFAVAGTALQIVEMVFHTAAAIDHANLVAGRATPIFTTHQWLAVVLYPIFGLTMIGFVLAVTRDEILGSRWIAWLGVLGALAHGLAPPLVVALGIAQADVLFPLLLLLALWLLFAAFLPTRAEHAADRETS